MESLQKIGKFEAIALLIMIMANQIILNLPNVIIIDTGSSAWLNVAYISIIIIVFCFLIIKLFKNFSSCDILDISNFLGGNFLKTIIGILYIFFFIFMCGILLRYLATTLQLIYFNKTPLAFILLLFLVPVIVSGKLGLKSVMQINLLLIPVLFFSMLILLLAMSKNFVFQRIYPILGFGINKTFIIGFSNIFAFSGFAYIYFLIPVLKKPEDFKSIIVSSTIISAIYLFLSVLCLLMIFPFIPFVEDLLSIYLITRIIEFGRFLQRVDAIFIFIWILSTISFLSFSLNFITIILKKIINLKNYKEMSYCISCLIFSCALIANNILDIKFLQNEVFKYVTIALVFIITPIILILANSKFKRRKSNET